MRANVLVKCLVVLWVALVPLAACSKAEAHDTLSLGRARAEEPQQHGLNAVVGDGYASVLMSDDKEQARKTAIENARVEAALKVAGLYLDDAIAVRERERLSALFKKDIDAIAGNYTLVSEEQDEDGTYSVRINATVSESIIKDTMMKNLYDDRVLVVTSERNSDKQLGRALLEQAIMKVSQAKPIRSWMGSASVR